MSPLGWLRTRDRDLAALRRAGRAAIVMPAMFAVSDKVIGNPSVATFAAFGSIAMLLLVDFRGPVRVRFLDQLALATVGTLFVCLGTLASRTTWLAAAAMALVAFAVLFTSVVSSAMSAATTSLLLAFILPVCIRGPIDSIPDRLAGWGLAAGASLLAMVVLWPTPARDPLRGPVAQACRAVAARLRSEVEVALSSETSPHAAQHAAAVAEASAAVERLRRTFYATPYRPTGLSTSARAVVRLVDEVSWLDVIVASSVRHEGLDPVKLSVCKVKSQASLVLELGSQLLDDPSAPSDKLRTGVVELRRALEEVESTTMALLPPPAAPEPPVTADGRVTEFVSSLDPGFRSQELTFVVSQIAANIDLTAAAERRTWLGRLTGRRPSGLSGPLSAAQERAASHIERHSVTLQNSLRGATGLGLAVLVADLTGVQHSFWVVLGTLSVLRSNALSTGQNILRGLIGTVAGFVIGAGILALIGTNLTLLWLVLPVSVLLAGIAPAAISFAAGQAAFTTELVILFNIIKPQGWRVGLFRVEDVAIGCAVSLVVGLLFWPRGAAAAFGQALGEAYGDSTHYLASAVEYGMGRCDATGPPVGAPTEQATRAAAAARRLDDTFRGYLSERGAKPVALAEVTGLVTGVVGLRLAAEAVLDIWQRDDANCDGDRRVARAELLASTGRMAAWYEALATSLVDGSPVPAPLERDDLASQRLITAVSRDLHGNDGLASATAVRMIWTGDHLEAALQLQRRLAEPARAIAERYPIEASLWGTFRSRLRLPRAAARGTVSP